MNYTLFLILILILVVLCKLLVYIESKYVNRDDFDIYDSLNIENFRADIPVFYINLDRSTDKRHKMDSQLNHYFNNIQRVAGIDGKKLKPYIYKNQIDNNVSYDLANFEGAIGRGNPSSVLGCLLSHIKTILLINEKGYDNAIILEDDTDLQYYPKWDTTIQAIINEAPDDWDIIKLFSSNQSKLKEDVELFKKGIKYRKLPQDNIGSEWSTGCYIINKRGISKIMKDIKNNEFKIDKNEYKHLVADYYLYNNKNVYEYTKPLVAPFQNNQSDIENGGVNSADKNSARFVKNFYSSI
jgi:glycosyl transferase, family 25